MVLYQRPFQNQYKLLEKRAHKRLLLFKPLIKIKKNIDKSESKKTDIKTS